MASDKMNDILGKFPLFTTEKYLFKIWEWALFITVVTTNKDKITRPCVMSPATFLVAGYTLNIALWSLVPKSISGSISCE
jgi:hypothetical protein